MRILHVRQPDHGGVKVIVDQYVDHAAGHVHAILHVGHRSSVLHLDADATIAVGAGALSVRRAARLFPPDVVHAHSSWAGVYARVGAPHGCPVVYTPHCFAFERLDVGRAARAVYRLAERLLLRRTTVLAGASEREVDLACELRGAAETPHVEHLPHSIDHVAPPRTRPRRPLTVVSVGRLCPQKRADRFAAIARAASDAGVDARFRWLGGGDLAKDRAVLDGAGVELTGWLRSAELEAALDAADAYVHVADWEVGDPLACIEAAARGLPVLVRRTPSSSKNRIGSTYSADAEAVDWLRHLHDEDRYRRASEAAVIAVRGFSPEWQSAALERIYSSALADGPSSRASARLSSRSRSSTE